VPAAARGVGHRRAKAHGRGHQGQGFWARWRAPNGEQQALLAKSRQAKPPHARQQGDSRRLRASDWGAKQTQQPAGPRLRQGGGQVGADPACKGMAGIQLPTNGCPPCVRLGQPRPWPLVPPASHLQAPDRGGVRRHGRPRWALTTATVSPSTAPATPWQGGSSPVPAIRPDPASLLRSRLGINEGCSGQDVLFQQQRDQRIVHQMGTGIF